jgi:NitT/TauT family transport system substrate-binding protein
MIKNHPDQVKRFLEGWFKTVAYMKNPANRTAALALISKFNKRPASDYESYVLTEKDYYRDPYAVPNVEALQKNVDLVRELGFGKTAIDIKKYVDLSFVEEAKKRLGGATPPGWQK